MAELVRNENMKIYLRTRTWIMIAMLPVILLGFAVMMKFIVKMTPGGAFDFMAMGSHLSTLAFIFSVIVAGDIVASEFTWGTVKLLLIRPASRSKILLAKYIAVILFMVTLLAVLFVSSYFIGLLFFGIGVSGPDDGLGRIAAGYGFKLVDTLMSVTLAFMISSAFRSSSLAIGLSMFLMFTAEPAVGVLSMLQYSWVKYVLFANTNLEPYFYGGKPLLPGMSLGFSVAMLVIYWVVFYAVAWALFTKRDVAG
ncbi:ABC transporter permease [Paenibacillus hamazuiensis]|uniref:ABC transporter permease n=1 Tax=Paenibacillus hamazuiensis TaxID=2936508 RepID=UPI0020105E1C|nr:ABC transporter permease [Paenibacillus hamazuiensis]